MDETTRRDAETASREEQEAADTINHAFDAGLNIVNGLRRAEFDTRRRRMPNAVQVCVWRYATPESVIELVGEHGGTMLMAGDYGYWADCNPSPALRKDGRAYRAVLLHLARIAALDASCDAAGRELPGWAHESGSVARRELAWVVVR